MRISYISEAARRGSGPGGARRARRNSSKVTREGMARYGIPSDRAFGVSMSNIQMLAKRLGRNHELAAALWDTGWYEARLLASYVDDPACVTPAQMDRWCRGLRQLGRLRYGLLRLVRPHDARVAQRS